ncbi:MAG: hypothetical protein GEV10_00465 [Streptosporangiales bacterium]|nr:hypothetical protein [Streptosporangiales bacterium]
MSGTPGPPRLPSDDRPSPTPGPTMDAPLPPPVPPPGGPTPPGYGMFSTPSPGARRPGRRQGGLPTILVGGGLCVLLVAGVAVFAGLLSKGSESEPIASGGPTSLPSGSLPSGLPSGSLPSNLPSGLPSGATLPSTPGNFLTGSGVPSGSVSGLESGGSPEDNLLYRTGPLTGVDCKATLTSTDPRRYAAYLKAVLPCLVMTWQAQLVKGGMAFQQPAVEVSKGVIGSNPCSEAAEKAGAGTLPSLYCPTNRTLYFSLGVTAQIKDADYVKQIPAHEFGHHVQSLIGLWPTFNTRYNESYPEDVPAYTLLNRRMELQAQCLGAAFLGTNATTMQLDQKRILAHQNGDEINPKTKGDPKKRLYGSSSSNRRWTTNGWPGDVKGCNTWKAPASSVG